MSSNRQALISELSVIAKIHEHIQMDKKISSQKSNQTFSTFYFYIVTLAFKFYLILKPICPRLLSKIMFDRRIVIRSLIIYMIFEVKLRMIWSLHWSVSRSEGRLISQLVWLSVIISRGVERVLLPCSYRSTC